MENAVGDFNALTVYKLYIFIFMNRRKYHFNHLDLNLKYELF